MCHTETRLDGTVQLHLQHVKNEIAGRIAKRTGNLIYD